MTPFEPSYVEITLSNGMKTKVSLEDYDSLSKYRWQGVRKRGGWYAKNTIMISGKSKSFHMHRIIIGILDKRKYVDHINHDTLDNRRNNLRIVSPSQNCMNAKLGKQNRSGLKGAHLTPNGKYSSSIYVNKNLLHLGTFSTAHEAHLAYCKAATENFGEFACFG